MMEERGAQGPNLSRHGDPYRFAPVIVTNFVFSVFNRQLGVLVFYSGAPAGDEKGTVVEAAWASVGLTKELAKRIGEELLRFAEEKGEGTDG